MNNFKRLLASTLMAAPLMSGCTETTLTMGLNIVAEGDFTSGEDEVAVSLAFDAREAQCTGSVRPNEARDCTYILVTDQDSSVEAGPPGALSDLWFDTDAHVWRGFDK